MIFFTYNRIKNKNPNPGFNIKKFYQKQDIIEEFTTYAINLKIIT